MLSMHSAHAPSHLFDILNGYMRLWPMHCFSHVLELKSDSPHLQACLWLLEQDNICF